MNKPQPLLRVDGLSKTYPGGIDPAGNSLDVKALQDVSFEIFPGEFVAVVGVNGSGKSTLVHCIASFEKPDQNGAAGPIQFFHDGAYGDVFSQPNWYRQNFVSVVFQAFHLLPNLRVGANVAIPLQFDQCEKFTVDPATRRYEVNATLCQLGIGDLAERRVEQISGGQKQRVAIARALIKNPRLLLADEPTGNLDEENKKHLVQVLAELANRGVAVLMVTHDHRFVDEKAHRIITLSDGKVVSDKRLREPSSTKDPGESAQTQPSGKEKETRRDEQATVTEDTPAKLATPEGAASDAPTASPDAAPENENELVRQTATAAAEAKPKEAPSDEAETPPAVGIGSRLLNMVKAVSLPGCSQRAWDLCSFAIRDAFESSISLASNVIAILFGTVLTALLIALLVGTNRFIVAMLAEVPGIDAVHVWADYSAEIEPMTDAEFKQLSQRKGAVAVVPNIQQFTSVFLRPTRDTIVTLVSSQEDDPELERLTLVKGVKSVDPNGWEIVINERVASDIDNFNPDGLVGKEVTIQLKQYNRANNLNDAQLAVALDYPVKIVGIVKSSPNDRAYGSLNMVRFIRDFSTGRSDYTPKPGGKIDLSKISERTKYEGLRLHFPSPAAAESEFYGMKGDKENRFDVAWPGSEMQYLRDVQVVAFLVLLGVGLITIVAGSISVFNTMRASVARKTREIGVMRALGATRGDVFVIYLAQALIIGFLAAVIGLVLAIPLCWQLNGVIGSRWEEMNEAMQLTGGLFVLPFTASALIFVTVLVVCVAAAFIPSYSAAQKTPMDALRSSSD